MGYFKSVYSLITLFMMASWSMSAHAASSDMEFANRLYKRLEANYRQATQPNGRFMSVGIEFEKTYKRLKTIKGLYGNCAVTPADRKSQKTEYCFLKDGKMTLREEGKKPSLYRYSFKSDKLIKVKGAKNKHFNITLSRKKGVNGSPPAVYFEDSRFPKDLKRIYWFWPVQ